jgi:hypothetical protein
MAAGFDVAFFGYAALRVDARNDACRLAPNHVV